MCDLYVVTVDTRGKSSSDITGYEEHICSDKYFKRNVANRPDVICYKSKVAKLCGLDLKVYFQKEEQKESSWDGSENNKHIATTKKANLNRAATLLTLDPESGFAQHRVRGVAYVVQSDGLAPLSLHQVWGIQELINYAIDVYKYDPDHKKRGKRALLKFCNQYHHREWGPLSIYQPRPEESNTVALPPSMIDVQPLKPNHREPFRSIQA